MYSYLRLTLRRRGLFTRDGFARAFSRARIRMRALPSNRQAFTMSQATVRAHIDMALDASRYLAPEIAFDLMTLIENLTDLYNVIVGQIVAFQIEIDPGLL
jgi:hypothetical protein